MIDTSLTPSSSSILTDRPKTSKQLRFKVPTLPLSTRSDKRSEEIGLIKKLYYNPFNELVCYQEYKQYQQAYLKKDQFNLISSQYPQPQGFDQIQECIPRSFLMQSTGNITKSTPQEFQNKQINLTDQNNRYSQLLLNFKSQDRQPTINNNEFDSRKSSLQIDDFKPSNELRQGSLNFQAISTILPNQNDDHFKTVNTNINNNNNSTQEKVRRNSSNNLINNFFGEKQLPLQQDVKSPSIKQQQTKVRIQKPKMLSSVNPISIKEQENEDYANIIKRRATQESQSYKEIKELNKFLKKERCQTTRILNRTKKKQNIIEQNLKKDSMVEEIDTKTAQEKQTIQYIIREQLNPQRPQEEVQKMLQETLRSNQIKNLMDKLKIEKSTQVATKILTKIKSYQGKSYLRNKYFSELEKDPNSLAQPLTVLVEYSNRETDLEKLKNSQKMTPQQMKKHFKKVRSQQLSLKDSLQVDFFKHVDPHELNRNKADTFYEIRSKAMTLSMQQSNNTSGSAMNRQKLSVKGSIAQLLEGLLPKEAKQQANKSNFFKQGSQNESQDIAAQPTANTDRQHYFDDIIRDKQVSQDTQDYDNSPSDRVIIQKVKPLRKPLLNGGIEYEYTNELGFKVRVQQPPKKKDYKEVALQKVQKKEDIFFNKFVKKANKIAYEVELRNRITDHTHKQQMRNYHK